MTRWADTLAQWPIPEGRYTYGVKDTMLYALGIGCGMDPLDEVDLQYVYEDGLKAFPAMLHVLGYPGFWWKDIDPAIGLDWRKLLHGEQTMKLVAPIPVAGSVTGRTRITGIYDRGPGRDALIVERRDIEDASTGLVIGHVTSTVIARGHGGFGGLPPPASVSKGLPESPADTTIDLPISRQAALIYRLSGDMNPLHASPRVAAGAGFPRPILQGLCTLGVATRAVLRALAKAGVDAPREFGARFSAPVFPGETLRTEVWRNGSEGAFRCRVLERDAVVLTNGSFAA